MLDSKEVLEEGKLLLQELFECYDQKHID